MTEIQKNALIGRLQSCLNAVRSQNSGADVHIIGNIRNSGNGLQSILETQIGDISYYEANEWCKRVEKQVIDFFKKKYAYHFASA